MFFDNRQIRPLLLAATLLAWAVCVSDIAAQVTGVTDTFADPRDGKTYKMVKMPDGKIWMAENLNYQMDSSWCYDDSDSYCEKYGRLYNWETAKKVCPAGWHLPSRDEWDSLTRATGGKKQYHKDKFVDFYYWNSVGKKLKAKSDWNDYQGNSGNGTNNYGFSALPGGRRHYYAGIFEYAGDCGVWWMATGNGNGDAYGWRWRMDYDEDRVYEDYDNANTGFSVRCVQDNQFRDN